MEVQGGKATCIGSGTHNLPSSVDSSVRFCGWVVENIPDHPRSLVVPSKQMEPKKTKNGPATPAPDDIRALYGVSS